MQAKYRQLKWKLSLAYSLFYYQANSPDMPQGHNFPRSKTHAGTEL